MAHLGADRVLGWAWVFLKVLFTLLRVYTRRCIIGGSEYGDYARGGNDM